MASSVLDLLEIVLKECARIAPAPLYPLDFVQATGIPRSHLDIALDQLRLGGLLRLTEWMPGKGQGYTVTEEGLRVLATPGLVDRLRRDGIHPQPAQPALRSAVRTGELTTYERGEAIREVLLNEKRPIVTQCLIIFNIGVFLLGLILAQMNQVPVIDYISATKPDPKLTEIHIQLGALHRSYLTEPDQWWRLLAHCFVHFGLLHLFLNMYFLFSVGPIVERIWGPVLFGWLYLSAGLGGGCAMALFSHGLGAGASGALCGILAAFLVWVLANRAYLPPALASSWTRSLLINVVLIVIVSSLPQVSAAGHFGGGLTGAIAAFPFLWFRYESGWKRFLGLLGMISVPLITLAVVFISLDEKDQRERFARRFILKLTSTDTVALVTYNTHVKPLLGKDSLTPFLTNREAVKKAVDALADAQEKIQKTLDLLENEEDSSNPKVEETVKIARAYFRAWWDLFHTFETVLRGQARWVDGPRDVINAKTQEINQLNPRLDKAIQDITSGL